MAEPSEVPNDEPKEKGRNGSGERPSVRRPPPRRGIGQQRELLVLLPVSLLILVLLSTFTLFAYRSTVELLLEERRAEATRLARKLGRELGSGGLPSAEDLRDRLPTARAVTIFDPQGRLRRTTDSGALVAPVPRRDWLGRVTRAPAEDSVSGSARFRRDSETFSVRVDLAVPILRSRERSLRILTPVLLTGSGAVTVLVLIFLRHFLAPFEGLLERARRAGQEVPESQDEVVFLVETFEQALEALARPAEVDELEALQGALAKSLESGVLLVDARGTLLAVNEIGAALLGLASPTPEERPAAEVLAEQPALVAILDRALRRGEGAKREECAVSTPRGERTLGVTVHPLRRDDAEVRGFLVLFADLTEVQEEMKENQLAESLSQLGELTAGVAHEMRNSLATLRGYLSLIERDPEGGSIADYLSEIRHESDHLQRVLEDLLTFARPGSVRAREVDLVALLHRAAADPALGAAAVEVEGKVADGHVRGDPQLLERAVRNLLHNAVEAQREAAREEPVRARVRHRDRGVEIEVDDRGPGLSAEAREKLFDPFFSQRPGGVGLGLALTRRIVLLHDGRIHLDNRPDGGVRATLWIPKAGKGVGKIDTIGNKSVSEPAARLPEPDG